MDSFIVTVAVMLDSFKPLYETLFNIDTKKDGFKSALFNGIYFDEFGTCAVKGNASVHIRNGHIEHEINIRSNDADNGHVIIERGIATIDKNKLIVRGMDDEHNNIEITIIGC